MGELSLEVRAEVSEVDNSLSFGSGVPGFRVRRVNTGVRMREGHTLALAGDYRELTLNEKRGIPFLMDSPIIGPLFRRTEERKAESELVFLITPRFVSDVDPTCVPRYGPGQLTESPSDHEFYWNAYNEVPRCNDDCPVNDRFEDPANYGNYRDYPASLEEIKQRKPVETPAGDYAPAQMPEDGMSRNRQGGGMLRGQPIEQPVRYPLPDGGSFSSPVSGGGSPDWPQRN
jgi:Flp pilus assembly secretin CpaC